MVVDHTEQTDAHAAPMPRNLVGKFWVQRTAGFLPLRFSKRIYANGRGVTALRGLALFPFRVCVTSPRAVELRYVLLPVRDEIVRSKTGWEGRGLVFGLEFCRFTLYPAT